MNAGERFLQADLMKMASDGTVDFMGAVAALISAGSRLLSAAIGEHAAGEAILGAAWEAVKRARQ